MKSVRSEYLAAAWSCHNCKESVPSRSGALCLSTQADGRNVRFYSLVF